MTGRIWDRYLTETDREVAKVLGFGARGPMGARPALLVVDMNHAFCGPEPLPLMDSIAAFRTACGMAAWEAVPVVQRLLAACRAKGVPVIYTTGSRRADGWDAGAWRWKGSPSTQDERRAERPALDPNAILTDIAPQPQDIVIRKLMPSGFCDTPLHSFLQLLRCDSLIVVGGTTSGCVRATVIDAFSRNIRCLVVEDAVFDRIDASHALSLFDMDAKYADVLPSDQVLRHVEGLEPGQFDLPSGRGM